MAEKAPKAQSRKKAPAKKPAAARKPTRAGSGPRSGARKKAAPERRVLVTRTSTARAGRPTAWPAPRIPEATPSPYDVILHPVVTEKTMFAMDKNNTLEFRVTDRSTKPQIRAAVESLFDVKVDKVNTRHSRDGKRAVVRFAEGYSAEDVGTRIGVF